MILSGWVLVAILNQCRPYDYLTLMDPPHSTNHRHTSHLYWLNQKKGPSHDCREETMPKKFYCSLPVHQVQARENPEQNLDATDYNNIPRNAANAEKKKKILCQ